MINPIQSATLTKRFFLSLPAGVFLVSNCMRSPVEPVFAETVQPANARQSQWQSIIPSEKRAFIPWLIRFAFRWSAWTKAIAFQLETFSSLQPPLRCRLRKRVVCQNAALSAKEVAPNLAVNSDTIYKWITRNRMPTHKLGRRWKFLASEVDHWVKAGDAADDIAIDKPSAARRRKSAEH